jgi:ZIP family zinc transporter
VYAFFNLKIINILSVFIWELLATYSLIIGGIFAIPFPLSNRIIGIIIGFGAGTLISAISYELICIKI